MLCYDDKILEWIYVNSFRQIMKYLHRNHTMYLSYIKVYNSLTFNTKNTGASSQMDMLLDRSVFSCSIIA